MRKNFFLDLEELLFLYNKKNWQVVIWGTGRPAQDVFRTLESVGVEVYAWGDNCIERQGTTFWGKLIISRERLRDLQNPLIIIACWMSFGSILRSLEEGGWRNVYGLIDSIKYDTDEMGKDLVFLSKVNISQTVIPKRNVLLEIYGNIGDILVHAGILAYLLKKYGDCAYVLAEGESLLGLLEFMTPNILVVNRLKFYADEEYRRKLLVRLQSIGFKKSIILSDARIMSTRRVLNNKVFPVEKLVYSKHLPLGDYLPQMDAKGLSEEEIPASAISPCRIFKKKINGLNFTHHLPERYIAINMGTSSDVRKFSPKKFLEVVKYILAKGLAIIFIGAGVYDENFFDEIRKKIPKESAIYSFISKLSVQESLFVISKSMLFVGTESGMWNASYVLEVPSVVIYGLGDYGSFYHRADYVHYVMSADYGCMGCCWFCTNQDEEGHPRCVSEISSEMIIEGIETMLRNQ